MNSKLFIAKKVKVGFNPRTDTYSGKLGYVIGHDGKKWRKEPSWLGWIYNVIDSEEFEKKKRTEYDDRIRNNERYFNSLTTKSNRCEDEEKIVSDGLDAYNNKYVGPYEKYNFRPGRITSDKSLTPIEFENVPTEGFVLNKKVGGYSNGWDHRSTYCRVYDPRGFEFEINVPNLLFILQECNAMKGKGLEGHFVYAWDGKDLVLLPTSSLDYKESQKFTDIQNDKLSTKDLVEGCVYKTKQMEELIYLGKFNWVESKEYFEKRYIFSHVKTPQYGSQIVSYKNLTSFAGKISDNGVSNYADLLDNFNKSKNSGKLDNINIVDYDIQKTYRSSYDRTKILKSAYIQLTDNKFQIYSVEGKGESIGYYYNYENKIINYSLVCRKTVTLLEDGDFKVSQITPIDLANLSYNEMVKLNLKTIKNNNKYIYF